MTGFRRLRLCVTAVVLVVAAGLTSARVASDGRARVYVIPIDGVIDLGLAPYVERTLAEAAAQQAAAVVLDISSGSGHCRAAWGRVSSAQPVLGVVETASAPMTETSERRRRHLSPLEARNGIVLATILGACRAQEAEEP